MVGYRNQQARARAAFIVRGGTNPTPYRIIWSAFRLTAILSRSSAGSSTSRHFARFW
ncbi:hypothetical protein NOVOSPHI9U_440003 [Novosphingobium sp. 9U]|nr:hypothetical protein NOVOSPHI9U_440003 [Novosphingobium sp. 9U]